MDVALASHAAWLLWPQNFGGDAMGPESRIRDADMTKELKEEIRAFRKTKTGQFVERICTRNTDRAVDC